MEEIKFKIEKDFRCFKKGEEITFPLIKNCANYIVGKNGSGKSTLIHYIRANYHDLFKTNKNLFDGMTNNDDFLFRDSNVCMLEGIEQFDKVFVLDGVDDNPTSFINSATASGLCMGGGLAALNHSNGQNSISMMSRFIDKIQKDTNFTVKDYKGGKKYDKHCLIILDEVDEGLDFGRQSKFNSILNNLAKVFNATVICITHNPLVIISDIFGHLTPVFDLEERKIKSIGDYIKEKTNLNVKIEKENITDNECSN